VRALVGEEHTTRATRVAPIGIPMKEKGEYVWWLIIIILLIGISLFSCQTNDPKIKIQKILEEEEYLIECKFQGCFGSGTEKLEIKNSDGAVYTYSDSNSENSFIEKTRRVSWGIEKQNILREIFEIGIKIQNNVGLCTTTSQYKLTSLTQSLEFEDLNCELTEKFQALLE